MGTFNTLQTEITCPHCKTLVNVEIELFFGDTRMMDHFTIGDTYKWISGRVVQNGGRPAQGNWDGEGFTECPVCGWHSFVKVIVRGDRIEGVEPDRGKPAYARDVDVISTRKLSEFTPIWESMPGMREIGEITYHEKWRLTAAIKETLEKLIQFGVDIFSTHGGSDYTILVPVDLSREQQEEVDRLMRKLGKQVNGKLDYIDWAPHGWKFRINPRAKGKS